MSRRTSLSYLAVTCGWFLAIACAGADDNAKPSDATGGSGPGGAVGNWADGASAGVSSSTGGSALGSTGTSPGVGGVPSGTGGTGVGVGGTGVSIGGTGVSTGGTGVGTGGIGVGTGGIGVSAGGTGVGTGGTGVSAGGTGVSAGGTGVGMGGSGIGGSVVGGGGGAGASSTGGTGTGGEVLGECDPYVWPGYNPDLDTQFDSSDVDPSSFSIYQGCDSSVVAGTTTSGWWSFIWGHDRNPEITAEQIQQVLDGLNEDLSYIRDEMGWPVDRLNQDGYFSAVYLYGSDLCVDPADATNTDMGGWQSNIGPYPMVLLSWAPIVNYDRGGITHEAIHAMVKGTPSGDNKPGWFNEGGNTWIQQQLYARRDGSYGVGFLDGAPFVAPHQPIECYSGWLIDGSFGGPDAQGVGNENWRRYLGGTQYNSVFAHFLNLYLSEGANAWIWQQAQPRNVLETLSTGLGDEQTRHLILEYRARQALVDFGPWSDSIIETGINYTWGQTLNREIGSAGDLPDYLAVAYAPTTTNGSTIVPDDDTLPGWSGANQIPLNVSGNEVRLDFNPTGANMRMQLAYWAEDGTAVYSQPVESGEACLRLDKAAKNNVVIAVVSNTDYLYTGDETRQAKFGYTVNMLAGATSTADRTTQWFLND